MEIWTEVAREGWAVALDIKGPLRQGFQKNQTRNPVRLRKGE
jgi:hypothetical protein